MHDASCSCCTPALRGTLYRHTLQCPEPCTPWFLVLLESLAARTAFPQPPQHPLTCCLGCLLPLAWPVAPIRRHAPAAAAVPGDGSGGGGGQGDTGEQGPVGEGSGTHPAHTRSHACKTEGGREAPHIFNPLGNAPLPAPLLTADPFAVPQRKSCVSKYPQPPPPPHLCLLERR
jgi:hypothetical protein